MKTLWLFLILAIPTSGWANCPVPDLPNDFILNERVIAWSTTLDLEDEEGKFGKVAERITSLTRSFNYDDQNDNRIATARQKILSWGIQVDVFDCENNKIGTIKENVIKSLLKVNTEYSILDPHGNLIAQSNKVDWLATSFTLKDDWGAVVATIERPMFNWFGDNWTINIVNNDVVDPRVLVMIGAYKTSVDNQRRSE